MVESPQICGDSGKGLLKKASIQKRIYRAFSCTNIDYPKASEVD